MAHYIYNWNGNKATLVSQNAYSLDEALNAIAALNAKAQDYDEVYSLAALSRNGEPAQTLYRLANGELSEIEERFGWKSSKVSG